MLAKAFANPRTTIAGILQAALVTFMATSNLEKLTAGQAAAAFGFALLLAIKGAITQDAQPAAQPAPVVSVVPPAPKA